MKKKLLFKNSTKYSQKLYDDFTHFHNEKNSASYDVFTIFILILLIYCIIATIKAKVIFLTVTFIISFLVFIVYRLFGPIYLYKKESNKEAVTEQQTFKFYFYNSYFKVRDNLESDKISYFKLRRVYETKKYFYLYLTKKYSLIISKASFTQGTAEEFSNFMKTKMKFKYSKHITKNSAKK